MTDSGVRDHWAEADGGRDLLEAGEVDEAVRVLEAVVTANPKNEYALYFLGNAHFEAKRWEKALKAYVTALELAPDYLGAMVGAGHALRMLGRAKDALRMGNEVLRRKKQDPDALYLLGVTYFHLEDDVRARQHLEAFLVTRPEAEVDLEVRGMLEIIAERVLPLQSDDDTLN